LNDIKVLPQELVVISLSEHCQKGSEISGAGDGWLGVVIHQGAGAKRVGRRHRRCLCVRGPNPFVRAVGNDLHKTNTPIMSEQS